MKAKEVEKVKTTAFSLYPVDLTMLDALRGREKRSSFIRHLIIDAWMTTKAKEQA